MKPEPFDYEKYKVQEKKDHKNSIKECKELLLFYQATAQANCQEPVVKYGFGNVYCRSAAEKVEEQAKLCEALTRSYYSR